MNRVFKKTIAAAMAGIMMCTGLPQVFADTVQGETQEDVEFIYDDWGLSSNEDGFFFMQGGTFGTDVDADAVLVLMDADGNKTEIPSQDKDGNRIFTKAVKSYSGSFYNMVKLENTDGFAFVRADGTYFGGEGTYFDYDYVYPISEYAIMAVNYETDGNTYSNKEYTLITNSGKTLQFNGEYVSVETVGDNILCYAKLYNHEQDAYEYEIYLYDTGKDEIIKQEGELVGLYGTNQYFAIREKDSDIVNLYNADLEKTECSFSVPTQSLSIYADNLDSDGYAKLYINRYSSDFTENLVSKDGTLWNTVGKTMNSLKVLDAESGYYYANVLNDETNQYEERVLSKDNSIDVNILDTVHQAFDSEYTSISSTTYIFNGDIVVFDAYLDSDGEGAVYILDEDSGYTNVKKLEDANYVEVLSDYLITANVDYDANWKATKTLLQSNIYNCKYEKIEVQAADDFEYDHASRISNGAWVLALKNIPSDVHVEVNSDGSISYKVYQDGFATLYNDISDAYVLLNKDGSVIKCSSYEIDNGEHLVCHNSALNTTDVYNWGGELIFSEEGCWSSQAGICIKGFVDDIMGYNCEAYNNLWWSEQWRYSGSDGSILVMKQSKTQVDNVVTNSDGTTSVTYSYEGNDRCRVVNAADGTVYYSSDDNSLEYAVSKDGTFLGCICQEDADGNRKYGAKIIKNIKRQLYSDSDVKVEFTNGQQIEGDVTLDAETYTETISFEGKIKDTGVKTEDVKYVAYDISLLNSKQEKIQPNGEVTVKLPCPAGYDGTKCKVYYMDESGKFTDMQAAYEDGYISFAANHFSTYLVTETELKNIQYGDVDGDGEITLMDSAMIRRYLAGWNVTIDTISADVNGDGEITLMDSAMIRRALAGWNVNLRKE